MLRILFFLVVVFALGLGFAWLAERPGDLVVTFGGYQYQVTLMVAAVILTAIVVAVMLVWWLLKSIWYSPYTISRYFRVRRRDRGYQALSTGMIAAGAGDAVLARKKKKEAMKLISADQEPLIHLLDAQASLLEGDHAAARAKFEAMLEDPETRLLGLRGLYLEAERLGDRTAARHYAQRAAEGAPQLGWATDSSIESHVEAAEWSEAMRLVETQKSTQQLERPVADRRKAVLLTAKAMSILDTDTTGARNAGQEAHRLAPDLVPAALIAARALIRLNDVKKAAKILEASWKLDPHPEVADLYVHARPGDSTHDRLARAKKLAGMRSNNVESSLAVARAALDAGEFDLARKEAEAAARLGPREGVFLLLADIEEAETGDEGKVRALLGRAVRAPRDPAWVADGHVAEHWAPTSPVTGRLDAFEWRPPVERLGELVDHDADAPVRPALASRPLEPKGAPATEAQEHISQAEPASETMHDAWVQEKLALPSGREAEKSAAGLAAAASTPAVETRSAEVIELSRVAPSQPAHAQPAPGQAAPQSTAVPAGDSPKPEAMTSEAAGKPDVDSQRRSDPSPAEPEGNAPVRPAPAEAVAAPVAPSRQSSASSASARAASAGKAETPASVRPLRLPDDPGVDPDEPGDEGGAKRFRLF